MAQERAHILRVLAAVGLLAACAVAPRVGAQSARLGRNRAQQAETRDRLRDLKKEQAAQRAGVEAAQAKAARA
ncbi:MAG: hypothetical protein FJX74_25460, partial [Armatimonadetes bacterium]|nr:hypothetical protein [Armatimonadota bacterium]